MGNKLEREQRLKQMVGNGAQKRRCYRLRNVAKARQMSYEAFPSRMEGNDNERNVDDRNRDHARCVDALTSAVQESSLTTEEEEKCYAIQDATLTFVDEGDVLDFFYVGYKGRRAKMSCGHAVTPMSVDAWCRHQLDEGGCEFVCGQTGCDVEWPFDEVCKMALLTPKEIEEFEKKMFQNAKNVLDIKFCPGCKSRVVRTDLSDQSVQCTVCTAKKKRPYIFCWHCLKKWKGTTWSEDCGNDDCYNPLEILKSCPHITFEDVEGVTGCPSVRACPTCGLLVEHDGTQCKNVVCGRCKVEFCFVCLKLTEECEDEDKYNIISYLTLCLSGVALRQTSIPVWT